MPRKVILTAEGDGVYKHISRDFVITGHFIPAIKNRVMKWPVTNPPPFYFAALRPERRDYAPLRITRRKGLRKASQRKMLSIIFPAM